MELLRRRFPELPNPEKTILEGQVLVNGVYVHNPRSFVRVDASIVVEPARVLRGEKKLGSALERFAVDVQGRTCLDVGASTGGFTRRLLEAGARKVYAVDVGFGQLLGSLRLNPRVVNLERTNLGELSRTLIPDPIDLVTIDVSYVSLSKALPQLGEVPFADGCELIALVKPMFELSLQELPTTQLQLAQALGHAAAGAEKAGWHVMGAVRSRELGANGAIELFLHARR